MQVQSVELIHLDVPFTEHTNQHMQYWLPHWRIVQLCKITLADGTIGWGETIPNYTWAKVPEDIEDRIVGRAVGDLLWQDALGAGVQQGAFRRGGQGLGLLRLIACWAPRSARGVRCRGGRWTCRAADWARQCADAVAQGYTTAKLKARTWYDLHTCIEAHRRGRSPAVSSSTWTSMGRSLTPPVRSSFWQPWSNTRRWP